MPQPPGGTPERRIVHSRNPLGPPEGLGRPLRGSLVALALLGACAYLPVAPYGGGTAAPAAEVTRIHPWMLDVRWPPGARRPSDADQLAIAEDIDALLTGDFDVYPLAARRLIQRGDVVLPCLGQAAERHPAPAARKERLSIVLGPMLREMPEDRLLVHLASPYATVRAAAAVSVGQRRIDSLGLTLVRMLEDRSILVRQAAIMSLRMVTGEFLEYEPDASPSARAAAAARWEELWLRRR